MATWEEELAAQNAEIARLREMNLAARAAQQPQGTTVAPVVAPQFSGGGDVRGQITGGQRSADGTKWEFIDQAGNVLTSMPLQDFYAQYGNEGGGGSSAWGSSINGIANYFSPEAQEQRRQQSLMYQQQQAAMASPGASVAIAPGMGSMTYNNGQFMNAGGPSWMTPTATQPVQQQSSAPAVAPVPFGGGFSGSGYNPFQSLNFSMAPYQARMQSAPQTGGLLGSQGPGMNSFFQRYWGKA